MNSTLQVSIEQYFFFMATIIREDISDHLIHFTKGKAEDPKAFLEESLKVFDKILGERTLVGGTGYIKGEHKCVCFTEAPIGKFAMLFANEPREDFRYSPYGFMFSKKWVYEHHGRPVIYGPDEEYSELPDKHKYRHVRFELGKNFSYEVDHTWEREWRINTEALAFKPEDVTLVVPHRVVLEQIREDYGVEWHGMALNDLGFHIKAI